MMRQEGGIVGQIIKELRDYRNSVYDLGKLAIQNPEEYKIFRKRCFKEYRITINKILSFLQNLNATQPCVKCETKGVIFGLDNQEQDCPTCGGLGWLILL